MNMSYKKKKKTCWRKWTCHIHPQIQKQTWTFHSHWWHTVCLRSRQNSSDHTCWLYIDFCWHTVFKCTPDIWWPHNANMVLVRKIHSEPGKVPGKLHPALPAFVWLDSYIIFACRNSGTNGVYLQVFRLRSAWWYVVFYSCKHFVSIYYKTDWRTKK